MDLVAGCWVGHLASWSEFFQKSYGWLKDFFYSAAFEAAAVSDMNNHEESPFFNIYIWLGGGKKFSFCSIILGKDLMGQTMQSKKLRFRFYWRLGEKFNNRLSYRLLIYNLSEESCTDLYAIIILFNPL